MLRGTLRGLAALSRVLGPARYLVADATGLALYAVQPDRRRRTASNHRRSAPDIDEREARRRARGSFREYARTVSDFLYGVGLDDARATRSAELSGLEHIRAGLERGGGVILTLGHFGNWDMAGKLALGSGLQVTTVMAPFGPPVVTDLVMWARQRNQVEVYSPEKAARGLLSALRRNRCVALLSDVPGAGPTVVVDYCGGPVAFSAVPAWLAMRTGAPLLPAECRREGRRYVAQVHPPVTVEPGDSEAAVMQRVATTLEAAVRRRPEQWYPFGEVWAAATLQD